MGRDPRAWVAAGLLAAAGAAGCAVFRWAGHPRAAELSPPTRQELEDFCKEPPGDLAFLPKARPAPEQEARGFTDEELAAQFYYDLGPSEVDVSDYPKRQQENYALFQRACSQCHTTARPLNSPRTTRTSWEYYVMRMRLFCQFDGVPEFNSEDAERIVDFLAYDSKVRKERRREEFEAETRALRRRFDESLIERMRILQKSYRPRKPQ